MTIERQYICDGNDPACNEVVVLSKGPTSKRELCCSYVHDGIGCKHTRDREHALYTTHRKWVHLWHMESLGKHVYVEEERI